MSTLQGFIVESRIEFLSFNINSFIFISTISIVIVIDIKSSQNEIYQRKLKSGILFYSNYFSNLWIASTDKESDLLQHKEIDNKNCM